MSGKRRGESEPGRPPEKSQTSLPLHRELAELGVLDYLALLWPQRSRRVIESLFADGRVRSGGRPVAARTSIDELGDLTLVGSLDDLPAIPCPREIPEDALAILDEDARFVVLEKPSGVPVVPDRDRGDISCLGLLIRRELDSREAKSPVHYVRYRIVHRIDRLTSGVVIVAKDPDVERRLAADFAERRVEKEYVALLDGVVEAARFSVNCPIVPGRKGKMRALGVDGAPAALTEFEVTERFSWCTLVRAFPRTGRTHQIRVHAWASGHPLVVDPLYGPRSRPPVRAFEDLGEARLTLHASRYTLPSDWEAPRSFSCPLAADLQRVVDELQRGAAR